MTAPTTTPTPAPVQRVLRFARGRPRHSRGGDRFTTPALLRLAMGAACVAILVFVLVVTTGAGRADRANETTRPEAIRPATLAQQISLDLAALDEIVVRALLQPGDLGSNDFPDAYDTQRRELQNDLVAVAGESTDESSHQQLVDLDYALAQYHALVRESFASAREGDADTAATVYGQAHTVMSETLLPEAEAFSQARLVTVGNDYDRHGSSASSFNRLVWIAWLLLVVVLVVIQVLVAKRFRRTFNWALAGATLLAALAGGYAVRRLDNASSHLASAHERALGAVHVLGQARVTAAAAWRADGQLLLDPAGTLTSPGSAPDAENGFRAEANQLFQVPDPARGAGRNHETELVDRARAGEVPDGSTGHLAAALRADVSEGGNAATADALAAFANLVDADADLRRLVAAGNTTGALARYEGAEAFGELVAAIDEARAIDQTTFEQNARSADDAASGVDVIVVVVAVAVAALVLGGLYQRLREYRT